jgi:probable HAF family extracellular repeat protein
VLTSAFAATSYNITLIDVPNSTLTIASGINNLGQIVGSYDGGPHNGDGFLLTNNTFSTFSMPGNTTIDGTGGYGINDLGQIVGWYGYGTNQSFLLSGGSYSNISPPGATDSYAYGINDLSQIVGTAHYGVDANNNAIVRGFLLSSGTYTNIDVPGSIVTYATGINNLGQIVGYYESFDPQYGNVISGFLFSGGTFTTFNVPGAVYTYALGINNLGQIVGQYFNGTNGTYSAFLLSGGTFTTLNLPPDFSEPTASGINDFGQIVGDNGNWVRQGFLATPIISVPSFVGLLDTDAEKAITGAWLKVGAINSAYNCNIPSGVVISQNPAAGTAVSGGTPVTLTVSLGCCPCDLNHDGKCNLKDDILFSEALLKCLLSKGKNCSACDLNGDGKCDQTDINIYLNSMKSGNCPCK